MATSEGGFVEIMIGGMKPQGKEPKYTKECIEDACKTLMKAKEIEADKELMPYVKDYMDKHKEHMKEMEKDMKKIKPKSIDDLRKISNTKKEDSEEGEEYE